MPRVASKSVARKPGATPPEAGTLAAALRKAARKTPAGAVRDWLRAMAAAAEGPKDQCAGGAKDAA